MFNGFYLFCSSFVEDEAALFRWFHKRINPVFQITLDNRGKVPNQEVESITLITSAFLAKGTMG